MEYIAPFVCFFETVQPERATILISIYIPRESRNNRVDNHHGLSDEAQKGTIFSKHERP